jgi:Bacterial PH domain
LAAFRPSRGLAIAVVAVWLGFVVLWATTGTDRAGRLLYGIAAAVLAALAATDLIWTPRLAVTRTGLRVRAPSRSGHFPWSDIVGVRIDRRLRFGIRHAALEVDLGDDLLVFSRRSLNADPEDVLEVIERARR